MTPKRFRQFPFGIILFLVCGLFITMACDIPDILDFIRGGSGNNEVGTITPTINPNGLLSYYGLGTADTTMNFSAGPVTCHEDKSYATLQIFPGTELPASSGFTQKLTSNELYFVAVVFHAYRSVGKNNSCTYWPMGQYNSAEVHGIYAKDTGQFTPIYSDIEACPNAMTLTKDGQNVLIDYNCVIDKNMTQKFHYELTPSQNIPTK